MRLPNCLLLWHRRRPRLLLIAILSCLLTVGIAITQPWAVVQAIDPSVNQTISSVDNPDNQTLEESLQIGIEQFQSEDYEGAIATWQTALDLANSSSDRLTRALVLSNLSLAHQHVWELDSAQNYMAQSLEIFAEREDSDRSSLEWDYYAKALNTLGWLHWRQGHSPKALEVWEYTTQAYGAAGNTSGIIGSWINQAKVLQYQGFSSQALEMLKQVETLLDKEPDSSLKVIGLRHLGNALLRVGELDNAEVVFDNSLITLAALNRPSANLASDLWLGLGNTYRTQWERSVALNLNAEMEQYQKLAQSAYDEAIAAASSTFQTLLSKTNLLSWLVVQYSRDPSHQALRQRIVDLWTGDLVPAFGSGETQANRAVLGLHLQGIDSWIEFEKTQGASDGQAIAWPRLISDLGAIAQQAESLRDRRSLALAWGYEGHIYEWMVSKETSSSPANTLREAKRFTQKAIALAEAIQSPDIQYRWEWQLGRILAATNSGRELCTNGEMGNQSSDFRSLKSNPNNDVFCTYEQAISTLEKARQNLLSINSDVQFSFRDNVEPLYREYVELLLRSYQQDSPQIKNIKIAKAAQLIDALQLAELENFLGCKFDLVPLNEQVIDPKSAIFYPVILPNSLDIILSLPDDGSFSDSNDHNLKNRPSEDRKQIFTHVSQPINQDELTLLLTDFRQELADPRSNRRARVAHERQLYQLLVQPFMTTLQQRQDIDTLVFVLDGDLRTIPVAALKEPSPSSRYLIDQYAIAIAPSLRLVAPDSLRSPIKVLAAGSSEPMKHPFREEDFTALPNVESELGTIEALLPTDVLFNRDFTKDNLKQYVQDGNFSIVHLATHGTFSSEPSRTFIAIHEGEEEADSTNGINSSSSQFPARVDANHDELDTVDMGESSEENISDLSDTALFANDLDVLLRNRPNSGPFDNQDLDLLVLSACETATGDNRATLGIAGLSIRAGARSTLATLWSVYDEPAAILMKEFYQQLANTNSEVPVSRLQALHEAQLSLRQNPAWEHPAYWAPYILVGSWL